jgi:hypothetical protein
MSGETECCCRGTVAGESGSRPGVLIELLEPEDEAACVPEPEDEAACSGAN